MAVLANDTAVKPRRRLHRARGAKHSAATRVSPCAVRKPGQAEWRDRQPRGQPPMTAACLTQLVWWIDAGHPAQPGFGVLVVHGRSSHVRSPDRLAGHVVGPALAAAGEVLAVGDQALVQLAGEQRDAVHTRLVLESVPSHADLAAAGLHQHLLVEERPLLSREIDPIGWPYRAGTMKRHERLRGSTGVLAGAGQRSHAVIHPGLSEAQGDAGSLFFDWHKPLLRTDENRCGARALDFGFGCTLWRFSGCPTAKLSEPDHQGAILRLTTKYGKS